MPESIITRTKLSLRYIIYCI